MSSEYLQSSPRPLYDEAMKALGGLVVPRQSNESIPEDKPLELKIAPEESEGVSARTLSLVTTLVKEAFQSIPAKFSADERDTARSKIREGSVCKIFKTIGALDNDDSVNDQFSAIYADAEAKVDEVSRLHLLDLSEIYENHPAMKAYDMLQRSAPIPDDIVYMRRVSLILIDEYSA